MKHLAKAEIAVIKARILRGDKYSEIASDYRINQGRIADLKFNRIHRDIQPADLSMPNAQASLKSTAQYVLPLIV